jgi:hypothetical protein
MRVCVVCGNRLTGNQEKYCSKRCSNQTRAPRFGTSAYSPKAVREVENCIVCNKRLTGRQVMYCSKVCKGKACDYRSQKKRAISRKTDFIERFGGKCRMCGYNKNLTVLSFHHRDGKEFWINRKTIARYTVEYLERELQKCDLLCMNCHLEHHNPTLVMAVLDDYLAELTQENRNKKKQWHYTGYCEVCGKELLGDQSRTCSQKCKNAIYQSYAVQQQRGIKRKLELVRKLGGKCSVCGYEKNLAGLTFHHIESDKKEYQLDLRSLGNRSIESIMAEFDKCQLLCANCHTELHNPQHEMS